jgi:hypothetical protein
MGAESFAGSLRSVLDLARACKCFPAKFLSLRCTSARAPGPAPRFAPRSPLWREDDKLRPMRLGRFLPLGLVLLALGCENGEECTKARHAASDSWKSVVDQAGSAKLKGWIGFDDLSEAQKADHVKAFTSIETQAEMIFKSFAYERITWKTADPARAQANQLFGSYPNRDAFSLFAASLKAANEKYDAAAKVCRD